MLGTSLIDTDTESVKTYLRNVTCLIKPLANQKLSLEMLTNERVRHFAGIMCRPHSCHVDPNVLKSAD